jgi:hypothetical protein
MFYLQGWVREQEFQAVLFQAALARLRKRKEAKAVKNTS